MGGPNFRIPCQWSTTILANRLHFSIYHLLIKVLLYITCPFFFPDCSFGTSLVSIELLEVGECCWEMHSTTRDDVDEAIVSLQKENVKSNFKQLDHCTC